MLDIIKRNLLGCYVPRSAIKYMKVEKIEFLHVGKLWTTGWNSLIFVPALAMFHEETSAPPSCKSQQLDFLSFPCNSSLQVFIQYFCCYLVFVGIQIITISWRTLGKIQMWARLSSFQSWSATHSWHQLRVEVNGNCLVYIFPTKLTFLEITKISRSWGLPAQNSKWPSLETLWPKRPLPASSCWLGTAPGTSQL